VRQGEQLNAGIVAKIRVSVLVAINLQKVVDSGNATADLDVTDGARLRQLDQVDAVKSFRVELSFPVLPVLALRLVTEAVTCHVNEILTVALSIPNVHVVCAVCYLVSRF